jgi:hypothetical protein
VPIGVYDGDYAFDTCVFDYPASAVTSMAWDERIPCAFKLLLPANVPRPQPSGVSSADTRADARGPGTPRPEGSRPLNYVSRIGNILPRFRAAGVRTFVDTAQDAWIVGESVLRSQSADGGEGVALHATRLRDQRADMLVPLDRTSL